MDHKGVIALCKASLRVRNGRWINGAPSHVFAELLTELEKNGWELRRIFPDHPNHPNKQLARDRSNWPEED